MAPRVAAGAGARTTTWAAFIRTHLALLAGTDFFTAEVLTLRGLVTYYVLLFIDVGDRRVSVGGITRNPDSSWIEQVARNATMQDTGYLNGCRYLLHDRDKEGLSKLILIGENSLWCVVADFVEHYHQERNHRGLATRLLSPEASHLAKAGVVQRRQRLGGMLNYYYRAAA